MEIPRLTPRQVVERLDQGEPLAFVDARSETAYQQATEQLPGSFRIAPGTSQPRVDDLPRGATVITYCT